MDKQVEKVLSLYSNDLTVQTMIFDEIFSCCFLKEVLLVYNFFYIIKPMEDIVSVSVRSPMCVYIYFEFFE